MVKLIDTESMHSVNYDMFSVYALICVIISGLAVDAQVTVLTGQYCKRKYLSVCLETANCTSVFNAYFTGPGPTLATSCPIQCNVGFKLRVLSYSGGPRVCIPEDYDGYNGMIQVPGVGEYCFEWYAGFVDEFYFFFSDIKSNVCGACYPVIDPFLPCPWTCSSQRCLLTPDIYDPVGSATGFCSSGCLCKGRCQSIRNGYFTGNGTVRGKGVDFTAGLSCPFECNAGFIKSNYSCV